MCTHQLGDLSLICPAVTGQVGQDNSATRLKLWMMATEVIDEDLNRTEAHQLLTHQNILGHVTQHGRSHTLEQQPPAK